MIADQDHHPQDHLTGLAIGPGLQQEGLLDRPDRHGFQTSLLALHVHQGFRRDDLVPHIQQVSLRDRRALSVLHVQRRLENQTDFYLELPLK